MSKEQQRQQDDQQSDERQSEDAAAEEAPTVEVSLEELVEAEQSYEQDLAQEYRANTQHGDGSTFDPSKAQEQGLVYTPPTDPPVLPSDDLQGADVAAGFAPSMEESDPDVRRLPPQVDNNDLDLEEDVAEMLRTNSETQNLTDVRARVRNRVVYLTGTVLSQDDISLVDEMVRDMEGVADVRNHLQTAEET